MHLNLPRDYLAREENEREGVCLFKRYISAFQLVVIFLSLSIPLQGLSIVTVKGDNSLMPIANTPITIENTQDVPTPNPFQAMLLFNSAQYSTYEASDLSNVAFSYSNGTVVPSWLASGNSNNASQTVYWVKVQGIAAGANETIFMNFFQTTSSIFNSQTTGEAPDLSSIRAQYDDGANVFPIYADFLKGLNGWQPNSFSGSFVPNATPNGIQMVNSAGQSTYLVSPTPLPATPLLIEAEWYFNYYGSGLSSAISTFGSTPFGTSAVISGNVSSDPAPPPSVLSNAVSAVFSTWWGGGSLRLEESETNSIIGSSSFIDAGGYGDTSTHNAIAFLAVNGTRTSLGYESKIVNIEGFGSTPISTSISGNLSSSFSNNALIISAATGLGSSEIIQWLVASAYPPNGMMPSSTFGPLASGGNLSVPMPSPTPVPTISPTPLKTSPPSPLLGSSTPSSSTSLSPSLGSSTPSSSPPETPNGILNIFSSPEFLGIVTLIGVIIAIISVSAFVYYEHKKAVNH